MARSSSLIQVRSHARFCYRVLTTLGFVGISHAYGGVLSALSITYTLDPVDGQSDVWKETEEVVAVYEQSRTVIAIDSRELKGDYGIH
jgi:hypothetical protein